MTTSSVPALSAPGRLPSIDLLRGLVMVFMLLDHMRDFLHREGLTRDPMDLSDPDPALYFTRWITHFCAPTFVFLAGTSARLQLLRGADRGTVAGFLCKRGLFLIALELLVLRPSIWFDFEYSFLAHLQVIWVIGCSMILLAVLVRLPDACALVFGVLAIAGHNLLDRVQVPFLSSAPLEWLWLFLHQRGAMQLGGSEGSFVFVQYPLLPWCGVMALGYAIGAWFGRPEAERRRRLIACGLFAIAGFAVLRGLNLYGDPAPWLPQPSVGRDVLAILHTEKYPPSLAFLLMTLGPALLALGWLEGRTLGRWARPLLVIGAVPLFFYLLQWPAIHLTSRLFQALTGQPSGWDAVNPLTLGDALPSGCGFGLLAVYLGWALGLLVLVPLCYLYRELKRRRRTWRWLSYL